MSGIFLKLRSTFYINLLKFLSFNIPMKRDSILDPSAYGFGNALAIRRRRALGSRLKAQWVFLYRTPKHSEQIISNTVKVPISHHVGSHSKWLY